MDGLHHRPAYNGRYTSWGDDAVELRTRYDAVVVGGGHNGLVAAAYLARAGQSVLVLERNDDLGGATCSKAVFPGMDARLSRYSYLVSLLPAKIVDDLSLPFTCRRRAIASCTPYDRGGAPHALLLSNVDEERSRASFCSLTGDPDWQGYRAVRRLQRALAARVWPSLLEPIRSRRWWIDSLETPEEREAWDALVERPLGETLERYIENDLVRGLLFTDAKVGIFTHPHDPTLLQNRCFLLHVVGRGTGEWWVPVGGMGALVDALANAARGAGADLVTGASVQTIQTGAPRHAITFHHDNQELAVNATRVLVNAGPQVFAHLLGEEYTPGPGDEGSVCKVNMLLRRLPRPRADVDPRDAFCGTFHVDESYVEMQTSYRQAASCRMPDHPPAEIYCHTLTDDSILGPELRDAGYQTLTLFGLDMPYRLFEADNDAAREVALRRHISGLNRVLADTIEDSLAMDRNGNPCIEIKTPVDLERELALNRGNIFHGDLSWFFAENGDREGGWGVETPYERVYQCGSSALRGGAVSGIPGHNAAQCIFEELGLRPPM